MSSSSKSTGSAYSETASSEPGMRFACGKVEHMPHVQIRNMPSDMRRTFKARAAAEGMSLSDYLLKELRPIAELPTLREWVAEVRSRPLYDFKKPTADIIREE